MHLYHALCQNAIESFSGAPFSLFLRLVYYSEDQTKDPLRELALALYNGASFEAAHSSDFFILKFLTTNVTYNIHTNYSYPYQVL